MTLAPADVQHTKPPKMFEKSLQDLVKGIRNTKGDVAAYIMKAIAEIKDEIKAKDVTIKAQALQKMTYVSSGRLGVCVC